MAEKGSVFQKGGGGTNFEQAVQTAFLTTLIIKGNAPLDFTNEITEVAFQTTNRGYETDDLFVEAKSSIGQHRLLVQIKNNITLTADNVLFKEVIKAFWKDFNNTSLFDKAKDKLIIIKSGFTKEERNHLKSLLNWANTHATETDFVTEVNRIQGKKKRLDIFRESLKEVNGNVELTDKEIWEFLKCFDILEYDFTNEISVDEIYFHNLIKLCKNNESTANEKEIWASITSYVSKLNKDGGSVTTTSIQEQEIYKYFDTKRLSAYFKSIEKLRCDSEVILLPLKNTIGGFHIDRKKIAQSIVEAVNNFQFTIVTGKPGVGKSAEIKDVLKNEFPLASVFVFRADQFNESHIAKVFSSQGVNESLHDIFSCISLIPDKIIFIDSLEKLLEADPDCAFKQLIALLKHYPDIKIIGSSRKYAIDLITQKFEIDKAKLGMTEVPPLDETELNVISDKFPQLKGVLKNEKIKKLLKSPKYLDYAILALGKSNDDYTNISLTEFKDKLWNTLVKDAKNRTKGFPAKREDAFMEIAINRAKEMKLFTRAENGDEEAIDLLENDEIIFQEKDNRRYSPTHDILEDWALVKYISSKYEEFINPKEVFENLGNEPAIRRAFRLWIEDYLIDDSNKINKLISATISDSSIEGYWADEILIAVFKSDNCGSFFSAFEKDLIDAKTNLHLLNRCIHLIRTACKESYLNRSNHPILLPIGSGWGEMMQFLRKHIIEMKLLTRSICNFLSDWNNRIMFHRSKTNNEEMLAAKEIILYYIRQIESGDEYWDQKFINDKPKELVSILYQLAPICKSEIAELIERAIANKEDRNSWKLNPFYKNVIDTFLSGLGNIILFKELPELIVQTAWREWQLRPIPEFEKGSRAHMLGSNMIRGDKCWGIEDNLSFFPPGIYKTPVYNLLLTDPLIGLEFIISFINYSVEFYYKSNCEYKHELSVIEIELNDGSIIKQFGCWELWAAYRDFMSVTHYAIESILMSLEKYLLDTASLEDDLSKSQLKYMFDYILHKSNNVSTTSVLLSVAMAYPDEIEELILPLISVKEFYCWDISRATHEVICRPMYDDQIHFALEQRLESKKLPHRTKYFRGLADFIVDYQINNKVLNIEIHKLFDKFQIASTDDDIVWKKTLTEIDIRKWELKIHDKKQGQYLIQPKYEEDVSTFMNSNRDYFEAQQKSMNYSSVISEAYELKEGISFEKWKEFYSHYLDGENSDFLYDKPITLSIIGLRDFDSVLTGPQKQWCIDSIRNSINFILQDTINHNHELSGSYSLMEKELALSSFHYLFANVKNEREASELIALVTFTLSAPFSDHEINKILEYVRTVGFEKFPEEAKRIWCCLIKYSEFIKLNPSPHNYRNQDQINEKELKDRAYVNEQSAIPNISIDISVLDFKLNEANILTRAFLITPYSSSEILFSNFIKHFTGLLTDSLKFEENFSSHRKSNERQIQFQETRDSQLYIRDLLLHADISLSRVVLDLIIDPLYSPDFQQSRARNELFEFSSKIPAYVIYRLDSIISNSTDELLNKKLIDNFWSLWEYLFEKIKRSGKFFLTSTLFLDIEWKKDSSDWKVLKNKKDFYHQMVKELGATSTISIMNLFSTAGEKTFLPEGISWLVDIFKADINESSSLIELSADRMIERLFYNHISEIKSNKKLIEDYIWILNRMIDLGSSEAYFFRENVITYKTIN